MGGPEIVISTNDLEKGQPPHEKHDLHQDETRNIPPSTYHDGVVELVLQHRPWLESLHQFMDPNAKGFAINLASRMKHFDIKVIHFLKSGKPDSVIKCLTPDDFERAISEDKERTGTLVIAKAISRAMIEAFGTKFELEPEFFANYLAGTELYRMGRQELLGLRAPARAPNLLPDYIRKAPFYTAEYRRPYHIEGGKARVFKLRVTETTTPRGAQIVHDDLPDVFFVEKISVYKKRGSNIGKPGLTVNQQHIDTMRKSNIIRILQASFLPINSFRMSRPRPTSRTQSHCLMMMLRTSAMTADGTKYHLDESSCHGSNV
jgi:hypothetical protein